MLLLISNSQAETCNPTSYSYRGKPLCFSKEYQAYLSHDCVGLNCGALKIFEKSKSPFKRIQVQDSRHLGAQACLDHGGKTTVVEGHPHRDQLCLCVAADLSAISCNRLGLR